MEAGKRDPGNEVALILQEIYLFHILREHMRAIPCQDTANSNKTRCAQNLKAALKRNVTLFLKESVIIEALCFFDGLPVPWIHFHFRLGFNCFGDGFKRIYPTGYFKCVSVNQHV